MVGYFEYKRALALFDTLLNQVTREELKVIEEIIAEREELAIETNLSSRIDQTPSTLAARTKKGSQSVQRGLGWMMALARIELAAMAAGFTNQPNPFGLLPPTRYELPAYKAILLDSFRTHYAALRNDPVVQKYWSYRNRVVTADDRVEGRRQINERRAIAYARRTILAVEFGEAVHALGRIELTPAQQRELNGKIKELKTLYDVILSKVLGLGSSGTSWITDGKVKQRLRLRQVDYNHNTGEIKVREFGPGEIKHIER